MSHLLLKQVILFSYNLSRPLQSLLLDTIPKLKLRLTISSIFLKSKYTFVNINLILQGLDHFLYQPCHA